MAKPPKKQPKKRVSNPKKVSHEEFFSTLRESAGLFTRTANNIKKKYGIDITRQAVYERANNYPEILADIREENLDVAEAGLQGLIRSKDERIRLRSIEIYLKTIGKGRGYVEKSELDVNDITEKKRKSTSDLFPSADEFEEKE